MPMTHTRRFRVRHYECDAYNHLNNANYLRFMQETAFDASAAAGYDLARYRELGRLWLVRETEIEYLAPVHYDDLLSIVTWVSDLRRATSQRRYAFHNGASAADAPASAPLASAPLVNAPGASVPVARGATLWVYIDATTGRPVTIPPELALAFVPELADPAEAVATGYGAFRRPFPKAPPAPAQVFSTCRRVRFHEIDQLQHVNNAQYLTYTEECGMEVLAAYGWPLRRLTEAGLAVVLRRNRIRYRLPAVLDDELEIATWAYDARRSSISRYYEIRRAGDGELLVEVHALAVWIALASGRPVRVPEAFLEAFRPNLSPRSD